MTEREKPGGPDALQDSGVAAGNGGAELLEGALNRLATGLSGLVCPGVGLWDPESGQPTPEDHYGQLSAALALRLLDDSDSWKKPRDAWLALAPERVGHAPFNRLLWLFVRELESGGRDRPVTTSDKRALRLCPIGRGYPSNNWTLLAGLCRVLEARTTKRRVLETGRLLGLLDAWMTPAGGFIDYPARPQRTGRGATPATYHHKALFVAVVAAWYAGDDRWRPRIERLLQWTLLCWDGWGHVGGFGRSTHALFGDACLLASLLLLGADEAPHRGCAHADMLDGLLRRWHTQFRADGLLQLNPAAAGDSRTGYDGYMHLSVYNAWAAAIVAWARHKAGTGLRPAVLAGIRFPCRAGPVAEDPDAGIVRVGGSGPMLGLIATRGQPPQGFSRTEAELRYAGGLPFHLAWNGRLLCPAPVRVSAEALTRQPALAGWTPVLCIGGQLHGLTDFESVEVEPSDSQVRITLWGRPIRLLRETPASLGARLVSTLDWRVLGGKQGRGAALKRSKKQGMHTTLVLTIALNQPKFTHELVIKNESAEAIEVLNPCGHAFVAGSTLRKREMELHMAGQARRSPDDLLSETSLPSSIHDAKGYCLPSGTILPGQELRSRLQLTWQP